MNTNPQFENMNNDVSFYKFGVFYFNKRDSRFMVPKASKLGYTINFAKPYAYIIIGAIVLAIVASILLT